MSGGLSRITIFRIQVMEPSVLHTAIHSNESKDLYGATLWGLDAKSRPLCLFSVLEVYDTAKDAEDVLGFVLRQILELPPVFSQDFENMVESKGGIHLNIPASSLEWDGGKGVLS